MADPSTADPFTIFLDAFGRGTGRRGSKRFNAGEHVWLGAHGARRAAREFERVYQVPLDASLFTSIRRARGHDELQYGELVALSGDFYETPDSLFEERPSPLPWLWEGNDLEDLRELFARELGWIETSPDDRRDVPYPEDNVRMAWNAKAYVELALRNTSHFGWHNLLAYRRHHAEALRLAAEARGKSNETFRRALYTNAFADHFLTDGFAAGHVRVPRAEILAWAEAEGFNNKVAGALSKVLHDQDGHADVHSLHGGPDEAARAEENGLRVQNSLGTEWYTHCDGQLFLGRAAADSKAAEQAVSAVSASVFELLVSWKRGILPNGVYAATQLVPFPHPDAPTLIEKFPAGMPESELEGLWDNALWYAKIPFIAGLERDHIRALLAALPGIMQHFQRSVEADVEADPEITARLAAPYIAAYRRIA